MILTLCLFIYIKRIRNFHFKFITIEVSNKQIMVLQYNYKMSDTALDKWILAHYIMQLLLIQML